MMGDSGGKLSGALEFRRQSVRSHFACFRVGLVERVNADDGARHGGRDLPAEELLAKIVDVVQVDAHDRMPCARQRYDASILILSGADSRRRYTNRRSLP